MVCVEVCRCVSCGLQRCHNAAVLLQVLDAVLRIAVAKHSAAKVCEGVLVNECGNVFQWTFNGKMCLWRQKSC